MPRPHLLIDGLHSIAQSVSLTDTQQQTVLRAADFIEKFSKRADNLEYELNDMAVAYEAARDRIRDLEASELVDTLAELIPEEPEPPKPETPDVTRLLKLIKENRDLAERLAKGSSKEASRSEEDMYNLFVQQFDFYLKFAKDAYGLEV